jgi:protein-disulfide isomerase
MLAAEAAREAYAQGDDRKFWRMHDLLFDNQQALERADLERYAEQVGLNMPRFRAALDAHTHRPAIEAGMREIDATGASIGTPSFFVNGRLVAGAQPYESFDAAVTRALAER